MVVVIDDDEQQSAEHTAVVTVGSGTRRAIAAYGQGVVVEPGETDAQALERLRRSIGASAT